MAKAFRTTPSEALCIVTGMTPIIKTEEAVKQYNIRKRKGSQTQLIDREVELQNWPHPADVVKIIEDNGYKEQTIQICTAGSKNEHGVGCGVAKFVEKELQAQLKFKLDNKCSNSQAKQLDIAKVLEVTDAIDIAENRPRTTGIFTDAKITIDSLKNVNNHSYIIEEIRKTIHILERINWTVEFSWVRAHVGVYGNELADQLAEAAACNRDTTVSFNRFPKSMLYSEIEEATQKMAKRMGKSYEGSQNKTDKVIWNTNSMQQ
jgi:ribonuclease HI